MEQQQRLVAALEQRRETTLNKALQKRLEAVKIKAASKEFLRIYPLFLQARAEAINLKLIADLEKQINAIKATIPDPEFVDMVRQQEVLFNQKVRTEELRANLITATDQDERNLLRTKLLGAERETARLEAELQAQTQDSRQRAEAARIEFERNLALVQREKQAKEAELGSVRQELDQMRARLLAQNQDPHTNATFAALNERLARLEKEKAESESNVKRLNFSIADRDNMIKAMNEQALRAKTDTEVRMAALSQAKREAETALVIAQERQQKLEAELGPLQSRQTQLSSELTAARKQIEDMGVQSAAKEQELAAARQRITESEDKYNAEQRRTQELERQIREEKARTEELLNQVKAATQKEESERLLLTAKDDENRQLLQRITETEQAANRAQQQFADQNAKLVADRDSALAQIAALVESDARKQELSAQAERERQEAADKLAAEHAERLRVIEQERKANEEREKALNDERARLASALLVSQAEVAELQRQQVSNATQLSDLQRENDRVRKELSEASSARSAAASVAERLQGEINAMQGALGKQREEIERLTADLSAKSAQVSALEASEAAARGLLNEAQNALAQALRDRDVANAKVEAQQKQLNELATAKTSLTQLNSKLLKNLNDTKTQLDIKTAEAHAKQALVDQQALAVQALEQQVNALSKQNSEQEAALAQNQQNIALLTAQAQTAEANSSSLSQQNAQLLAAAAQLQTQHQQESAQLAAAIGARVRDILAQKQQEYAAALGALQTQIDQNKRELEAAQTEAARVTKALADETANNAHLLANNQILQRELDRAIRARDTVSKENSELQQQLSNTRIAYDLLKTEQDNIAKQLEDTRNQQAKTEAELKSYQDVYHANLVIVQKAQAIIDSRREEADRREKEYNERYAQLQANATALEQAIQQPLIDAQNAVRQAQERTATLEKELSAIQLEVTQAGLPVATPVEALQYLIKERTDAVTRFQQVSVQRRMQVRSIAKHFSELVTNVRAYNPDPRLAAIAGELEIFHTTGPDVWYWDKLSDQIDSLKLVIGDMMEIQTRQQFALQVQKQLEDWVTNDLQTNMKYASILTQLPWTGHNTMTEKLYHSLLACLGQR